MKRVAVLMDEDGHFWVETPGGLEPIKNLPHLFTEQEVAEYFGVTVHAVRYWRKNGLVEFIKVQGQIRFTQQALERLIATRTVQVEGRQTA